MTLQHCARYCLALFVVSVHVLVARLDQARCFGEEQAAATTRTPLDSPAQEQIGTALGQPVYRDQIRSDGFRLSGELHRLFSKPMSENYRKENRKRITPTEQELKAAADYFTQEHRKRIAGEYGELLRKSLHAIVDQLASEDLPDDQRKILQAQKQGFERQLKPSDEQQAFLAQWTLNNWKFQRFLYDEYGGGRILWQQAGIEAFDAMHKWLKEREAAGDFEITDPKLRESFYEYWTNEKMHGSFLTSDEERIRTTFLEPPWLSRPNED